MRPLEDRDACERAYVARKPISHTFPTLLFESFSMVNAYVMLDDRSRNCEHCCMSGKMHEHHKATHLMVL